MARFKISAKFRELLSDKLMDLGNYSFVPLVIGQLLDLINFSIPVLIVGVLFGLACYIMSYIISK